MQLYDCICIYSPSTRARACPCARANKKAAERLISDNNQIHLTNNNTTATTTTTTTTITTAINNTNNNNNTNNDNNCVKDSTRLPVRACQRNGRAAGRLLY